MLPRWTVLLSGLAVAAILAVGFVDHQRKAHAMRHASVAQWLCVHRGRLCGGENQESIEQRWNARERAYAGAIGLIVLANLGVTFARRFPQKPTL